jgi:hypothetical protein
MGYPDFCAVDLYALGGTFRESYLKRDLTFDGIEKKRFFLIEFFEDSTNTERAKRALLRHAEAIESGAPSTALNLGVGHRVLCIFRHEHTARAIMNFVKETQALRAIADGFLFKTHESIWKDAFDHWGTASMEKVNIL